MRCLILLMCTNWFMQLEAVLAMCTSQVRYWSIYAPRSFANGTGETVLPNKDNEIGGSLLISCAEPTTTNFCLVRVYKQSICCAPFSNIPKILVYDCHNTWWNNLEVFNLSLWININKLRHQLKRETKQSLNFQLIFIYSVLYLIEMYHSYPFLLIPFQFQNSIF